MTTNHQTVEESIFALAPTAAIAHLKASGNWPTPSATLIEPASDYYVLAAFWGRESDLDAYLAGHVPAVAQVA